MIRNLRGVAVAPVSRMLLGYAVKSTAAGLQNSRSFHHSARREAVIPYILADIGEGKKHRVAWRFGGLKADKKIRNY
jgi:hypothetical protein